MAVNDKLFRLIHSMSKHEKGYFKRSALHQSDSRNIQYMHLFDLINKQKKYDEKKIIAKLSEKKAVRNFRETKHYLYNLILKVLQNYSRELSLNIGLRSQINEIDVLMLRGMYEDSIPLLKKMKAATKNAGKISMFLDLHELEIQLLQEQDYKTITQKQIQQWYNEGIAQLEELRVRIALGNLSLDIIYNFFSDDSRRENKKWNEEKVLHLLKQFDALEKQTQSIESQRNLLNSKCFLYSVSGRVEQGMTTVQKTQKLFDENPEYKKTFPYKYILHLTNYGRCLEHLKKIKEAAKIYREARSFIELNKKNLRKDEYLKAFSQIHFYQLGLSLIQMDYSTVDLLIKENTSNMNELLERGIQLRQYYYILYQMAIHYFIKQSFSMSLEMLSEIMDHPIESSYGVFLSARVLYLLCHFELDNRIYFPHAARSLYRYLRTKKHEYRFEKTLIRFLSSIIQDVEQENILTKLAAFRDELIALQEDPKEAGVLDSFDYIIWLNSKIEKKPFMELLKQQQKHPSREE